MKKNALLVGGTGFVGTHMCRQLEDRYTVTAVGRSHDVRSESMMTRLVTESNPDIVINFASLTTVRETFENPEETYRIGFQGMLNLLNALKRHGFRGRVLNISSSEVYGHPGAGELPISEQAPLRPMSPYAVCKTAAEALCYQWSRTEGFDIVTVRPFTHIGPGQSDRFAVSSFAKQVAEIHLGKRSPVLLAGNLDTTRDLTDVRDTVKAYDVILCKGCAGEIYNVCSGREVHMRELLENLLGDQAIEIRQDTKLLRASEQRRLCGSYEKLNRDTGWNPSIPLSHTLADMVAHWKRTLTVEKR